MKWFKHDSNASVDAKLERMIMKYGMEGYGLYWYCLEMIARTVEKHNLTFELEHDAEVIAHRTGIHFERVQEMMSYMVKLRLFENDRGVITCLKMSKRTDEYTQKLINSLGFVPILSRQSTDSVGKKSELIEENRIEENRNKQYVSSGDDTLKLQCDCPKKANGKDFERFWESWPVKRNKAKAKQVFIRKKFDLEDVETLIADVKDRIKHDPQWKRGFIPHCSTYLNGERWEDSYNGN